MDFPNYFADADSDFKDSDYVIVGMPYDKTSSFRRGARHGPKEIRQASWNFETFNLFTGKDLKDYKIHDYGDLDITDDKPADMITKVKDSTSNILKDGKIPISIGGEHSITSGIIQAFPEDIAVISFDAHMDFRNTYEHEKYNHACVMRRISEHVDIKNIFLIGVRSADKEEFEEAKKQGLKFYNSLKIQENGIKQSCDEIKKNIKDKKVYITLDIDAIDPAYAPGTSTPEPFGLLPIDIIKVIKFFSSQIIGFDLVEVCPDYDNGETALLAAKIIRNIIEMIPAKN